MYGKRSEAAAVAGALLATAGLAYAGVVEEHSNPVPSGAIVIDGAFDDWAGVVPFSPDSDGDAPAGSQNWKQVWMAHDDTYIYVRMERAGASIAFNSGATAAAPAGGAGYWMVLDTDENPATGLGAAGPWLFSVGGEFSANAFQRMNRWGAGGATCALGAFPFAADSLPKEASVTFEASISRSSLGSPADFNIAFRGENSGDYYPDGAVSADYFHYTTGTPIDPLPAGMLASLSNAVSNGAIQIDGDLADWDGIVPFPVDPIEGGAGQDWVQVWIAHDDENFYFRVERAPGGATFDGPLAAGFWGLLDTDRDPSTGIQLAGPLGCEYNFGAVNIWNQWTPEGAYSGTSFAWGATATAPRPVMVEGAIRRSDLGDPAAINLIFVGENSGDFYPDAAFAADYFRYIVHEPTPTGGDPVEVYTLSNQVANGAITLDGDPSDWADIPSFPPDAVDGGVNQDFVKASIAHDDTNVYFLMERSPGSMSFSGLTASGGYWAVLDTDRDRSTGFTGFAARSFSIGGEYNISSVFALNAWSPEGCHDPVNSRPVAVGLAPREAEIAIARTTLGNPGDFHIVFVSEHSPDLYPDTADTQVFHYTTETPLDPLPVHVVASLSNPVADGAIQMDGDITDWAGLTPYPEDPAGDGAAGAQDWAQVWIAHDSQNFYFRLKHHAGAAPFIGGGAQSQGYWGAIDTDKNPATGIRLGAGVAAGAEFNLAGMVTLNAWNPDGAHAGGRAFAGSSESGGTVLEVMVPRADIGNPPRFRVIFAGEHSGDYYPEGAHSDKTFLYTFLPCNTPFADADNDGDVDQDDFGVVQACFTGPGVALAAGCECFDRDYGDQGDGDIDLVDVQKFENCAAGPEVPPQDGCEL